MKSLTKQFEQGLTLAGAAGVTLGSQLCQETGDLDALALAYATHSLFGAALPAHQFESSHR